MMLQLTHLDCSELEDVDFCSGVLPCHELRPCNGSFPSGAKSRLRLTVDLMMQWRSVEQQYCESIVQPDMCGVEKLVHSGLYRWRANMVFSLPIARLS